MVNPLARIVPTVERRRLLLAVAWLFLLLAPACVVALVVALKSYP